MELLLDTQNNCFLCSRTIPESESSQEEMCLRNICRFLQINPSDVLLQGLKERQRDASNLLKDRNLNFCVNLCNRCYDVTNKLSHLIQDLELIHLKVNYYTELFEGFLDEASDSTNSEIGKNEHLLTPDSQVVEYLREKAKHKCSRRRKRKTSSRLPVVRLKRLDCRPITTVTQVMDVSADNAQKLEKNLESHFSSNISSEDEHCSDIILTQDPLTEVQQTARDMPNTFQIDENFPTINSYNLKMEMDVINATLGDDADQIENNLQPLKANAIQLEDKCETKKADKVASEHASANDTRFPNTCTRIREASSELNNFDGNTPVFSSNNSDSSNVSSFLNISYHYPNEEDRDTRDPYVTPDISYSDSTINLEPIFDYTLKKYFCQMESLKISQCVLCECNIKSEKSWMRKHVVCRHPEKLLLFAKRTDVPEAVFEKLCCHVIEKEIWKCEQQCVQPRRSHFVCYLCNEVVYCHPDLKNHIVTSHRSILCENLRFLQGNQNNWLFLMNSDSTHTFNSQLKERQNETENDEYSLSTAAQSHQEIHNLLHNPEIIKKQSATEAVNIREPSFQVIADSPRHSIEEKDTKWENAITQCSEMLDNPGCYQSDTGWPVGSKATMMGVLGSANTATLEDRWIPGRKYSIETISKSTISHTGGTVQLVTSCDLPSEMEHGRRKRKTDVNNIVVPGSGLETSTRGALKSFACLHCKKSHSTITNLRFHMLRVHPGQIFLSYKRLHRSESQFANSCRIIFNHEALAYTNDNPGAAVERECAYCTETRRYEIDYLDHLVCFHKDILAAKITALEGEWK